MDVSHHRPASGNARAACLFPFLAGAVAATVLLVPLLARLPARALAHEMPSHAAPAGADTFQSLMDEAMRRMDAGMAVAPSGDPDRDFARMMIPHHQGAVDMALVELRFGHDERLRRLAQGIVVEQRQEIQVMQSILDGGGAASPAAPSTPR